MTDNWKEITDPEELFKFKREGWEIERSTNYFDWYLWSGDLWHKDNKFRARPRQPKIKKVKLLAWLRKTDYEICYRTEKFYMNSDWIRQPKLDIEGEVPDEQ